MKILIIVIFTFILTSTFAQSPWVAEKGKGYGQIGYTTIGPYKDLFLSNGDSYALSNEVTDQTIQAYGEYGIGSGTSLIAALPIKMLKSGPSLIPSTPITAGSGDLTTLGNLQLAARHNFINKKIVLSGQLLAELPTAGYDETTGLRGGLDALSIIPSVSIGKGLSNFYGYLSSGIAVRSNKYSSDFRVSAEVGYKIINRIYIVGVLDIVESFENGDAIESTRQLEKGLYLNNQSYFAYGVKGIIGFTDNLGITGAYYSAGSGHLVAKSPSINFGVYYKW